MDEIFQIGSFCFRLRCPQAIIPPPNFMLFQIQEGQPEYTYDLEMGEGFPVPVGDCVARKMDLEVFRQGERESRLLGIKGTEGFYGFYEEDGEAHARILVNPQRLSGLSIDPVFTSLLALERRLAFKDAMVLHCAYLDLSGEALLFSAPSGTGKTTQANLWKQYQNCETVNGDRALLARVNGSWQAQGWPVCGTSEICCNRSLPVRAVVMLSQGMENQIERLSPAGAFSQLYSQITVNKWNRQQHLHVMDLLESLVSQVPVFHLSCTISHEAVTCLEAALNDLFQTADMWDNSSVQ